MIDQSSNLLHRDSQRIHRDSQRNTDDRQPTTECYEARIAKQKKAAGGISCGFVNYNNRLNSLIVVISWTDDLRKSNGEPNQSRDMRPLRCETVREIIARSLRYEKSEMLNCFVTS